jgi:hypothetical protein
VAHAGLTNNTSKQSISKVFIVYSPKKIALSFVPTIAPSLNKNMGKYRDKVTDFKYPSTWHSLLTLVLAK